MDMDKGKWEKVAEVPGNKCQVPKLQEGHQYKFRVVALNKNGDSEPLETADPITAKNPFGKLYDIKGGGGGLHGSDGRASDFGSIDLGFDSRHLRCKFYPWER